MKVIFLVIALVLLATAGAINIYLSYKSDVQILSELNTQQELIKALQIGHRKSDDKARDLKKDVVELQKEVLPQVVEEKVEEILSNSLQTTPKPAYPPSKSVKYKSGWILYGN